MLGAIIGDIVGSRFEFNNTKDRNFEFLCDECHITDDSAMTIAVMQTMLEADGLDEAAYKEAVIKNFKKFWLLDDEGDYGLGFTEWLKSDDHQPYNSYGNGALMRVSPCALSKNRAAVTKWTTEVSHNHTFALNWAEFLTKAIWYIRNDARNSITDAKRILGVLYRETFESENRLSYYPDDNWNNVVRPGEFDETCQGIMPLVVQAILTSDSFTEAIRSAVVLGGDTDTIACVTGALADAVFGVPESVRRAIFSYIPDSMRGTVRKFTKKYHC